MFNNYKLSDEEVFYIIDKFKPLIVEKSYINHKYDEDLNQEIVWRIYSKLTKNREDKINIEKI